MLHRGPLGRTDLVCHSCDTPACCTLSHLFKSTTAGNMADKVAKGRQARAHRKLTVEQARNVLSLDRVGWSLSRIAVKYRVTPQAISHIVSGKNFKYLAKERE